MLLRYAVGTWFPFYGVNQSEGYSVGYINVVDFGERSLMYYPHENSFSGYRPYGYYSSPWP